MKWKQILIKDVDLSNQPNNGSSETPPTSTTQIAYDYHSSMGKIFVFRKDVFYFLGATFSDFDN